MSTLKQAILHSDSDDDDYVPPEDADSDSEPEDKPSTSKRPRTPSPQPTAADLAEKKKAREALWASFQASVSQANATPPAEKPMVTTERRYLFAGKEVIEIVQVPEDSADAKKWPFWRPERESSVASSSSVPDSTHSISEPAPSSPAPPPDTAPAVAKRPGPRKSRLSLAALPSPSAPKPKKLTTLDKSAMDWRAHIDSGASSQLKDELEANRRSGGYLEKVEFMKRVDERKDAALEAIKGGKRRKL